MKSASSKVDITTTGRNDVNNQHEAKRNAVKYDFLTFYDQLIFFSKFQNVDFAAGLTKLQEMQGVLQKYFKPFVPRRKSTAPTPAP